MTKNRLSISDIRNFFARHASAGAILIVIFSLLLPAIPRANASTDSKINQLQQQIDQAQRDNAAKRENKSILNIQAASLSEAITKFQAQIDASQNQINQLETEIKVLQDQIVKTEAEIERNRKILGANIKSMYLEGDITTLEMLAMSKNLSEFFDKQQYRESVQAKIKDSLDKITALKQELNQKKNSVELALSNQKRVRAQLDSQKSEKNRILALNKDQQGSLENQIRANNGRIAEIKKQKQAMEAALAQSLRSGSYRSASSGRVSAGQVIGSIGNSGFSSGSHLHLEARKNGTTLVNPGNYIKVNPTRPVIVTQGFWEYNTWYANNRHTGIDYDGNTGDPIYAVDGGTLYKTCMGGYGYVSIVEQDNGVKMIYAHQSGGPPACSRNTFSQ